ncbi:MAG: DUF4377 domain-containing protein [Chitinophagaceae bacterium]|nr:MAG: DUF4377 domain-containing protein [Chitinophagaceae bacterium]
MQRLLVLLFLSAVLLSCKKDGEDFKLKLFYVAPQKGSYVTWFGTTTESIMVKEKATDTYVVLGQDIEGFAYEEGFSYRVEVIEYTLKDPPQDASDKRYVLKRIISKQIE